MIADNFMIDLDSLLFGNHRTCCLHIIIDHIRTKTKTCYTERHCFGHCRKSILVFLNLLCLCGSFCLGRLSIFFFLKDALLD